MWINKIKFHVFIFGLGWWFGLVGLVGLVAYFDVRYIGILFIYFCILNSFVTDHAVIMMMLAMMAMMVVVLFIFQ